MTNPWAHGRINNESSYDLILVDKTLAGTDQYRWNKEPPVKIPAKTQMNDIYDASGSVRCKLHDFKRQDTKCLSTCSLRSR